jgi:alkaline phosphatase
MNKKTIIIAEAGVNHNGCLSMAMELVDVAAQAGADFVKFQTFSAEQLVTADARKADYQQAATFPLSSETHGGEDVPAYALGFNADALGGVMEQNLLFNVMRDALLPGGR